MVGGKYSPGYPVELLNFNEKKVKENFTLKTALQTAVTALKFYESYYKGIEKPETKINFFEIELVAQKALADIKTITGENSDNE